MAIEKEMHLEESKSIWDSPLINVAAFAAGIGLALVAGMAKWRHFVVFVDIIAGLFWLCEYPCRCLRSHHPRRRVCTRSGPIPRIFLIAGSLYTVVFFTIPFWHVRCSTWFHGVFLNAFFPVEGLSKILVKIGSLAAATDPGSLPEALALVVLPKVPPPGAASAPVTDGTTEAGDEEEGQAAKGLSFMFGYLLPAILTYWPWLIVAGLVERKNVLLAWRSEKFSPGRPYINVVKMHLLILGLAFWRRRRCCHPRG